MKLLRYFFTACSIITLMSFSHSLFAQGETTHYSVFCASHRIEIDMRDLTQMKSARGSDVCQFSSFTSLSSAEDFAKKNFGGVGAACSC